MSADSECKICSRWIHDFEKQVMRGKHVLLYGNVHDQFLWNGQYVTMGDYLSAYFAQRRFDITVRYDPVDGFRFPGPDIEKKFEDLANKKFAEVNPGVTGAGDPETVGTDGSPFQPTDPGKQPPPRKAPGAVVGRFNRRVAPADAFARLRLVMAQSETSVASILDVADMLTSDPTRYAENERNLIVLLKKCALEASVIRVGALAGYRNTMVITAGELKRVPEWFHRDNPFVSIVQISRPDKEERKQFAVNFIRPSGAARGFFGGDQVSTEATENDDSQLEKLSEEFADLTDGFQAWDMEALRRTSWVERISIVEPRKLIDFFKFGLREDPWEKLNAEKVRDSTEILSKRVIGQPQAVESVTTMLTSARVGLSMVGGTGFGGKPKGVFFFVGPTGVGKTELAKAVTELVFGDEKAFARFDMSEYKEEHAAEKLAGAPPGFVGYEEGGQLTNRVIEHPYSILLFDEVEKAHPKVMDKFLQILEDGRLTDGKGQTAYFNQTAIIFTSNIGASDLTDAQTGTMLREGIMRKVSLDNVQEFPYELVEKHFRSEVQWYFTSRIGRAELLNRLGDNIVVFDLLRPEHVAGIGGKFLRGLQASARERYVVSLTFREDVLETLVTKMKEGDNLLFGGRRVKTLLESLVEKPLNRWFFENVEDPKEVIGATLELGLPETGVLEVKRV